MLYKLCKDEKIHRIVKGQYILPDDMQDELLSISKRSGNFISCYDLERTVCDRKEDAGIQCSASVFGGATVSKAMSLKAKIRNIAKQKNIPAQVNQDPWNPSKRAATQSTG